MLRLTIVRKNVPKMRPASNKSSDKSAVNKMVELRSK